MFWKVKGREISLDRTLLMGALNLTPDSFSDAGKYLDPQKAITRALRLIEEGADILDLGAESTRPGAEPVPAAEEIDRLLPVLEALHGRTDALLSIDTTKSEVAKICLEKGAHIINDVSGLRDSGSAMAELAREFEAGIILMHRRGDPKTMNLFTDYEKGLEEIKAELESNVRLALAAGISREQIVIDPGLGFSKTAETSIAILSHLELFHDLGFPVLIGPSRKSFIGQVTGRGVHEREFGTAACVAIAVLKGAGIVRVHDAGAMRDAVKMAEAIRSIHHVGTF